MLRLQEAAVTDRLYTWAELKVLAKAFAGDDLRRQLLLSAFLLSILKEDHHERPDTITSGRVSRFELVGGEGNDAETDSPTAGRRVP
jgi:hypothetical protein